MRLKRSVTIDEVMSFGPCYSRDQVEGLFAGRKRMTLAHLSRLTFDELSIKDRLWLLLRPEFISEKTLHLLACTFAERAMQREREAGREPDKRSWDAIRVTRRWVAAKASEKGLSAAEAAAWSAWSAAEAAAWSARSAAWSAAWSARSAAEAELLWQYEVVLEETKTGIPATT